MIRVGVISDTHGYLHPRVCEIFHDADAIVHAGDIGPPEILHRLGRVAPVHAVRGNTDDSRWAHGLPAAEMLQFSGILLYMLHDLDQLDLDPQAAGVQVVISGHTHRACVDRRNGVMHLNPGSASLPRGASPASVALLRIQGTECRVDLVELPD